MGQSAQLANELGKTLQRLNRLTTIWLVGSYNTAPTTSQGLDLLAVFADGDIHNYAEPMIKILGDKWPGSDFIINDDSVQFKSLDHIPVNIAAYRLELLLQQIHHYANGRCLEGQHRTWTNGYWLPEALCGDLATSTCLYDSAEADPFIRVLVEPYPDLLAQAIKALCILEIEQKLVILEKSNYSKEKVEIFLAINDIIAASLRFAFAESRCYLMGFKRLEQQACVLNKRGRSIYELAQNLTRNNSLEEAMLEIRAIQTIL